ncbi:hypothetical protein AAFF_G00306430 [Aldrovandia affinis]|uniref:Uncharacterized protein n=1 Tax=Aldrovandia affinis TaxID=143900 RepID=A0AAD7SPD9_9TELE|nr:hypothetical protein AAFF_G00306430 [Aldrovandia affinis]
MKSWLMKAKETQALSPMGTQPAYVTMNSLSLDAVDDGSAEKLPQSPSLQGLFCEPQNWNLLFLAFRHGSSSLAFSLGLLSPHGAEHKRHASGNPLQRATLGKRRSAHLHAIYTYDLDLDVRSEARPRKDCDVPSRRVGSAHSVQRGGKKRCTCWALSQEK